MVRIWYLSSEKQDQSLSPDELKSRTGVLCWQLNVDTYETDGKLALIRKDRGYDYNDVIDISPESLPDYESRVKGFHTEHLHTDEEIRFILKGSAYFDVRDGNDVWIRILVTPGDLLVLPAGIYHRLTLVDGENVTVLRLFRGEPIWTAHNRPADHLESRKNYISQLQA